MRGRLSGVQRRTAPFERRGDLKSSYTGSSAGGLPVQTGFGRRSSETKNPLDCLGLSCAPQASLSVLFPTFTFQGDKKSAGEMELYPLEKYMELAESIRFERPEVDTIFLTTEMEVRIERRQRLSMKRLVHLSSLCRDIGRGTLCSFAKAPAVLLR